MKHFVLPKASSAKVLEICSVMAKYGVAFTDLAPHLTYTKKTLDNHYKPLFLRLNLFDEGRKANDFLKQLHQKPQEEQAKLFLKRFVQNSDLLYDFLSESLEKLNGKWHFENLLAILRPLYESRKLSTKEMERSVRSTMTWLTASGMAVAEENSWKLDAASLEELEHFLAKQLTEDLPEAIVNRFNSMRDAVEGTPGLILQAKTNIHFHKFAVVLMTTAVDESEEIIKYLCQRTRLNPLEKEWLLREKDQVRTILKLSQETKNSFLFSTEECVHVLDRLFQAIKVSLYATS